MSLSGSFVQILTLNYSPPQLRMSGLAAQDRVRQEEESDFHAVGFRVAAAESSLRSAGSLNSIFPIHASASCMHSILSVLLPCIR